MQQKIRKITQLVLIFMLVFYDGTGLAIASAQAVRGNTLAAITIVEYADFQCSDCARSKIIIDQVLRKYDGQVKLELRHNPLPKHP